MPSPFPGMDPYLENPARWPGVHHRIISALAADLMPLLPDGYFANIEERVYIAEPGGDHMPDVAVFHVGSSGPGPTSAQGGGVPRMADMPVIVTVPGAEVREPFIEIVALNEGERVVTIVEVLSPTNKHFGTGRVQYERKQRRIMESEVHLVEVDLLRTGPHTVAAHEERLRAAGLTWDYIISLHRAGAGPQFETWPRSIRERLPVVWVPLTAREPDVALDIQAALIRAYDEWQMGRLLNYRNDPVPPLPPGDAAWADALLREKGLRS